MKIVRNHPLTIGEVVLDVDVMYFGIITDIDDKGIVHLAMNKDFKHNFDCEKENRTMFDDIILEEEKEWEAVEKSCYQVAWGLKDMDGNVVCFEHIGSIDYPYYSPGRDENLYSFETSGTLESDIEALAELKAKLSPDSEITITREVAEAICRYCEDKAIYDKLGKYNDFYYKLKKLI